MNWPSVSNESAAAVRPAHAQPERVGRVAGRELDPRRDHVGRAGVHDPGHVVADAVALRGAVGHERRVRRAVRLVGRQGDRRVALGVAARDPAVEAVLEVGAQDGHRRRRRRRCGDQDVVDEDRVRRGLVGAADVDLAGRGVDLVGQGVGAADRRPAGGVDRGVADPGEVGLDDEPACGRAGRALGQPGAHRERVHDVVLEQAGRRLDALVVLGPQDAQRLAAGAVVDERQGRAAGLGPGAGRAVVEVDRADDLGGGRRGRRGDQDVVDEDRVRRGLVGAADVDLAGRGVDLVGQRVRAADRRPAGGVDRGVADPREVGLDDEPRLGRAGRALGQPGAHRERVHDVVLEQAGRRLDALEVLGAQDAQRLAAGTIVDERQGRAAGLGPGAGRAVVEVDGGDDLRISRQCGWCRGQPDRQEQREHRSDREEVGPNRYPSRHRCSPPAANPRFESFDVTSECCDLELASPAATSRWQFPRSCLVYAAVGHS